jgi:protein-arginine kinase activator protein McsA
MSRHWHDTRYPAGTTQELQELEAAVARQDFEKASQLRDIMDAREEENRKRRVLEREKVAKEMGRA